MAELNVLAGGKDVLREMRQELVEADTLKARVEELKVRQKQLEKEIDAKQKARDAEITTTIAKRQTEIENSFSSSIDKTRARIKMVREKRDKHKIVRVGERVKAETKGLVEEKRSLRQELKGVFRRYRIPGIFNNKYFFSLFMPTGYTDYLTIFLTVLILTELPLAVLVLLKDTAPLKLFLFETAVPVCLFLIYTLIFFTVRNRKAQGLAEAAKIRADIAQNRKQRKAVEKAIRKDPSETGYGLEQFDSELAGLEAAVSNLIEQQNRALTEFETGAKQDIIGRINSNYDATISELSRENGEAYDEQRRDEERLNDCVVNISRKYEAYIDKALLTVPVVDSLTAIIESGAATTVADALEIFKRQAGDVKKGQQQ